MDFAVVALAAFVASGLTLYSGFGLGTVLLPAFALFFPAPVAVAATAAVHLLNNLFKGTLLRRQVDWRVVARFGLPAIPAAIAGAWLLNRLASVEALYGWSAFGRLFAPTPAGVVIGALMILFAILELQPWFRRVSAPESLMPLGGLVTGFFGGLTGQQGAFRSMFLLKSGLEPARLIATGVFIAVLVDLSRIPTYLAGLAEGQIGFSRRQLALVSVGALCAFAGAYVATRFLKKATIGSVRAAVTAMMLVIGAGLVLGVIGT